MLKDLVKKCRSYRRFYEDTPISREELEEMVDTARLTASTANSQALKYRLVDSPEECDRLFPCLAWAGALKDWNGPEKGEQPSAYIVILCDLALGKNKQWDEGIAAQTILLAATEMGYGGCMIGSCRRSEILSILQLEPEKYSVGLVLALGKPKEEVHIVPVKEDGNTAYYRDENQVHYVPKRGLGDILV